MNKRRKILAAMLAAFMLLVPMVSTAQIDIKGEMGEETSDLSGTWGTTQITDYQTEEYVPLGEGLWLLAGAAGLYLLVKSRKTRKATAVAAAALALTLGTTQCKKTEESVIPAGETIFISLNGGNGAGSKADINVNTGSITWNADDEVYVVCNNATATSKDAAAVLLTGNLTAQTGGNVQAKIMGSVTVPAGYTLPEYPSFTFYYVGKGVVFDKDNFTFSIADQKTSYVNDAGEYMIGRTETIVMKNAGGTYQPKDKPDEARKFTPLTSVLRLNTSGFGSSCEMTMSSGNNKMEIDLSDPDNPVYKPGNISFAGGKDVQISVMPSREVNVDATLNFSGNSKQGSIKVKNGVKPGRIYAKIINNASTPILVEAIPEGALPGLFSVSADKQVRFSKGNLWYNQAPEAGKPYWGFEEHQYDCRTYSDLYGTPTNTYGLFGWGDVPANGTDIKTVNDNSQYVIYTEWGSAIDDIGTWRTLTADEWNYLLFDRDNKYKDFVSVGEETGLVILPDEFLNGYMFDNLKTTYSLDEWADAEAGGLVFLPTAGERFQGAPALLTWGYYWSSSRSDEPCPNSPNINGAYYLGFNVEDGDGFHPLGITTNDLFSGYAVRLVHAVPNTDGTISIDDPGSGGL